MSKAYETSRGVKITAWVIAGLAAVSCVNSYNKVPVDPETARIMKMQSDQRAQESAKADLADLEERLGSKCTKDKKAMLGEHTKRTIKCGWGKPNKINRTTNNYGTREQWVYDGGGYLYFENDVLVSVQN